MENLKLNLRRPKQNTYFHGKINMPKVSLSLHLSVDSIFPQIPAGLFLKNNWQSDSKVYVELQMIRKKYCISKCKVQWLSPLISRYL